MGVCPHTVSGEMFPGDEGAAYDLNPGEGWAESFRLANSLRLGAWPDIGWPIVDDVFKPDATALALVEQDVLEPWTAPVSHKVSVSLKRGEGRRLRIATPLDGTATASVAGPPGIRVAFAGGRGARQSASGRTASTTVCGGRVTSVTLKAKRAGRFVLTYSNP
jgi:hypothetical protein